MKNKLSYRLSGLLYLALTAVALICCIKEDRSQCDWPAAGLSVVFTDPYQNNQPDHGLNTDEFFLVTLFIYNHNKELIATHELYDCVLNQKYTPEINLPFGSYEIVTWIGTQALFYVFDDIENLDKASLSLWIPEDHLVDYWVSHIYYGDALFTLNSSIQVVEIPLIQLSNDINITVEGLDDEEEHYTFFIADNNGKYSFKSSYMPCEEFGYQSDVLFFSVSQFQSRITTLRLAEGRTPMLYLVNDITHKVLYPSYDGQDANIISLIKKAYNTNSFNFDAHHVFNLSLVFDADMRATVYIDNWQVKDDNYDL